MDNGFPRSIIIIALVIAIASAMLVPYQAAAEVKTIAYGRITKVDETGFPDIVVRAILRNGNNDPVQYNDLVNVQLFEDSTLVDANLQEVTAGVESVTVVDFSKSVLRQREDIQESLQTIFSNMDGEDTMGFIIEEGETAAVIEPLTMDTETLLERISQIPADTDTLTGGTAGLQLALNELEASENVLSPMQSIVFLSAGIQDQRDIDEIINQASELEVTIHTVLFDPEHNEDLQKLQTLATATGGEFVWYRGAGSMSTITTWTADQRIQTEFTYRSTSSSSTTRTLELRTTANEFLADNSYDVVLQAPTVIITSPANNTEQVRQADSHGENMELVEPTTLAIRVQVEWPDGLPRELQSAQLYLDGDKYGAAMESPPGDNVFSFIWDLKPYRDPVTDETVTLKVTVVDEFGIESTSEETKVFITVIIPDEPTPMPQPTVVVTQVVPSCEDIDRIDFMGQVEYYWCQVKGLSNLAGFLALGIAVIALVLMLIFRRPLASVAQSAGGAARDFIVNLTKPASQEVVGAYLRILRGEDSLIDKPIPLYINTVTPMGRDLRQAEVVLQADVENSIVSRRHCEIVEHEGVFRIRDYGSAHGTYVNNYRLPEGGDGQILHDGDEIALGPIERGGVSMIFQLAAPGGIAPSSTGGEPGGLAGEALPYGADYGGFDDMTSLSDLDDAGHEDVTRPSHDLDSPDYGDMSSYSDVTRASHMDDDDGLETVVSSPDGDVVPFGDLPIPPYQDDDLPTIEDIDIDATMDDDIYYQTRGPGYASDEDVTLADEDEPTMVDTDKPSLLSDEDDDDDDVNPTDVTRPL